MQRLHSLPCGRRIPFHADGEFPSMRTENSLPCERMIPFYAGGEFHCMRAENSITCSGEFHYMQAENSLTCGRRIPLHAGGEFHNMWAENSITCGQFSTECHGLVLTTQHMSIWCSFLVFLNFVGLLLKMKLRIYFYFDYILNFMKSSLIYH
jgi:hypothetical protein